MRESAPVLPQLETVRGRWRPRRTGVSRTRHFLHRFYLFTAIEYLLLNIIKTSLDTRLIIRQHFVLYIYYRLIKVRGVGGNNAKSLILRLKKSPERAGHTGEVRGLAVVARIAAY